MMAKKAFYHEVVGPTRNLLLRAAENVCVEPDYNDVVSLAKYAAFAAYHFREKVLRKSPNDKLAPMTDTTAEVLRQRLGDVVDSAKHGPLRDPDRDTTFRACLAFEYDESQGFRFLRTEVLAKNNRSGEFELSDTILEFVLLLGAEMHITWNPEEIEFPSHSFLDWAETYLTPKSGFDIPSVGIRTYKRDANKTLIPFDLPEIKFRVMELVSPDPSS
jgi:hypothetical protein